MKRTVFSGVVVTMLALGIIGVARASAPGPTFADGNYGNWTLVTFASAGGSASQSVIATDGYPTPPLLRISHVIAPFGFVTSIHINEAAVYSPATQGAITSVDFTEFARTFSTEAFTYGGASGPALGQGGAYYVCCFAPTRDDYMSSALPSPWKQISFAGLSAQNFGRVVGPGVYDFSQHPDFSSGGATIRFGLARHNSHTGSFSTTRVSDNDGWQVHVSRAPGALDADGDGVPDSDDACPASEMAATVVIAGTDTGVANILGSDGCTLADGIAAAAAGAATHGAFVSAVAALTDAFRDAGLISGTQKGMIQRAAAQARIP